MNDLLREFSLRLGAHGASRGQALHDQFVCTVLIVELAPFECAVIRITHWTVDLTTNGHSNTE